MRHEIIVRLICLALCALVVGCGALKNYWEEPERIVPATETTGILIVETEVLFDPSGSGDIFGDIFNALTDNIFKGDPAKVHPQFMSVRDPWNQVLRNECIEKDGRHYVIFEGLAPGEYSLVQVEAWKTPSSDDEDDYYDCPKEGEEQQAFDECPSMMNFTFQIDPNVADRRDSVASGHITYLGKLSIMEKHRPPYSAKWASDTEDNHTHADNTSYAISVEQKLEAKALDRISYDYEDTPWHEIFIAQHEALMKEIYAPPQDSTADSSAIEVSESLE